MGHRTSLNLISSKKDESFVALEANNQLPFFWVLLLNDQIITQTKNHLIKAYHEEKYFGINLNSKTLRRNCKTSLNYLNQHYPDLKAKFKQFSDYTLALSKKGVIEVDLMGMSGFSSPEDFLDGLQATLSKIGNNEPLNKSETLEYISDDFTYLVGHDDFSPMNFKFSSFSKEYNQLQVQDIQKKKQLNEKRNKDKLEKNTKERLRTIVFDVIGMGIFGLLMLIIGLASMFIKKAFFNLQAIALILFGFLSILFAYFKYKGLKKR